MTLINDTRTPEELGMAFQDNTGAYLGHGDTEVERAADAAFQELLDEVDPLDWGLVGVTTGTAQPPHHDEDVAGSRLALLRLMLHHGWLPPEPRRDYGVESLGLFDERPEWGDVARYELAMDLRNATDGSYAAAGRARATPSAFWLGLADLAAQATSSGPMEAR